MTLSKDARRLLKAAVKSYKKRIKRNADNPTWFRVCQFENEFKHTRIKDFELARRELCDLGLFRKYDDGGFAITHHAVSYMDNYRKIPLIRVVWFVFGAFAEWLICKGFDIGFDFILQIIRKL